ncbi:uncharacterized protein K452DRAFT_232543 [Aplosporella prunicola CBS 121167]|uniref:Peptidase A1 domain-containing protein n=1 Tax=Aplosporella prunicola CBS 121167 TaxID=1176127 RepID=A0A6A6B503_9PEZI|nr:uncharacterized protein K452DRAFT_232543 [Aplosporella prunicola CBS 121167]KAF2139242.1 hypothetical protein K452DRAFT_232543 [Aplosporella prunicola CBS 121167]
MSSRRRCARVRFCADITTTTRTTTIITTTLLVPIALAAAAATTAAATASPPPLAFTPDQNWDGIDGPWSSFTLRVGRPAQTVRVLASTGSQQTWVVAPGGCAYATGEEQDVCATQRGGTFNASASASWKAIGSFALGYEQSLGFRSAANYGYDAVGLGNVGDGGPTLANTTVGAMMALDFFLGSFGLHPKPTNFTSWQDESPSYMTMLKDQGLIPSLSYGYTAGNQYRLNKVLASLTLGGYDSSKFVPNNVSFAFAPDNERDLVVCLQAITMESSTKGSLDLLPEPAKVYIDSTVSQIWLPVSACEKFEEAFGLTYDNETDLYLVNDTLHERLAAMNPRVTFTLGTSSPKDGTVDIVLPYKAFDLTAQPPYQGLPNATAYFPLRRGMNGTQYTLGRAFLQEAYIIVDHERANFSVSQCIFDDKASQELVGIADASSSNSDPDKDGDSDGDANDDGSLGTAAIAGLAVGLTVFVIAVGALVGLFYWRKRYRKLKKQVDLASSESPKTEDVPSGTAGAGRTDNSTPTLPNTELDGTPVRSEDDLIKQQSSAMSVPLSPGSAQSNPSFPMSEVEGQERQVYEMPGDMPPTSEADGRELSEKQAMLYREAKYNGTGPGPLPTSQTSPERVRPAPISNPAHVRHSVGATDDEPISPLSAEGAARGTPSPHRRRFSFEEQE